MPKRYYVVQTHPGREQIAEANLKNQKFDAFLPTLIIERQHPAGYGRKRLEASSRVEPLFPTYLFVNVDLKLDQWRSISGTRGVVRMLGEGETPCAVDAGLVEDILANCQRGAYDQRTRAPEPLVAGSRACVQSGQFAGLIGDVLEARAKRVKLLLNVFGGAVKVVFSPSALVPA